MPFSEKLIIPQSSNSVPAALLLLAFLLLLFVRGFPDIPAVAGLSSVAKLVRDIPVASAAAVADVIAVVNVLRVQAVAEVFAVDLVPALA